MGKVQGGGGGGMFSRNQVLSMVANMSTAYNLTVISLAMTVMGFVYPENTNQASATSSAVKTAALIGAIIGQLTMGYVGDCLGRSRAMNLTMSLTILGSILSAINQPFGQPEYGPDITHEQLFQNTLLKNSSLPVGGMHHAYAYMIFCRVVLGIGVGGVYPLAATVSAESATDSATRGRQVSLVFSTQGIGFLLCPIVILILIAVNPGYDMKYELDNGTMATPPHDCYKFYDVYNDTSIVPHGVQAGKCNPGANDLNWRLALLIGALPGILMFPFKVQETSNVAKDTTQKSTFWQDLGNRKYWKPLIGTAGGWFFFDIVFYGNSLCAPLVTKAVFTGSAFTLKEVASHNAIVFMIALPGYWVATIFMDKLGRKNIQILGFSMMTLLFSILAFLLAPPKGDPTGKPKHAYSGALLLVIYGLTFFFANFGPNSTTFILPSETFPTEVRASLNGFSAACGKAGAAIGSSMFKPLALKIGVSWVLGICAIISLIGVLITFVFVGDHRRKSLKTSEGSKYGAIGSVQTAEGYEDEMSAP